MAAAKGKRIQSSPEGGKAREGHAAERERKWKAAAWSPEPGCLARPSCVQASATVVEQWGPVGGSGARGEEPGADRAGDPSYWWAEASATSRRAAS